MVKNDKRDLSAFVLRGGSEDLADAINLLKRPQVVSWSITSPDGKYWTMILAVDPKLVDPDADLVAVEDE